MCQSEGPKVNSPAREGGVNATISCLSAEGAPRSVPARRASDLSSAEIPPPSRTGLLTPGPPDLESTTCSGHFAAIVNNVGQPTQFHRRVRLYEFHSR